MWFSRLERGSPHRWREWLLRPRHNRRTSIEEAQVDPAFSEESFDIPEAQTSEVRPSVRGGANAPPALQPR